MPILLRVDCSPRQADAHSLRIADEVADALRVKHHDLDLRNRQLTDVPPPFIDAAFAAAMRPHQTRESAAGVAALQASETLIGELEASDYLIISTPMHNYTVPASLKAWIDQVVRFGRTFQSTPEGKIGLLKNRPTFVVLAAGGYFTGERARQPDYLSGYLLAILATIGIHDVTLIPLEGLNRGPEAVDDAYRSARGLISRIAR